MDPLVCVSTPRAAKKSQVRRYGRKAPFTKDDIAAIRTKLTVGGRDRALFETALCTALRAGDLLALRRVDVEDPGGVIRARITVGQMKTRRGVEVNLLPAAEALAAHIAAARLAPDAPLFSAHRRQRAKPLTVETFRSLVKKWADMAGHQDVSKYAAHSTRRTLATAMYARKKDVAAVRHVLGHASTAATAAYLGVGVAAALDLALECAL
jgi:integrase